MLTFHRNCARSHPENHNLAELLCAKSVSAPDEVMYLNIYDVSEKAGVSIATVSRVINNSENVSEKNRKKVLSVMEELGYTPNVFARGLNLNTMKTIGIMCSDSSDTYLANAVYYLEQELRHCGYDSFLCCTGYELATKQKYFDLLLSKRVDAMILVGSSFLELKESENGYIMEGAKRVPIMLMNGCLDKPGIYSVYSDDFKAMYDGTKRLIMEGHKRILFLYKRESYSGNQKLAGYKKALLEAGIAPDEELILKCPKELPAIFSFIEELYEKDLSFDAILASEDIMALGAVKYANAHGISVPKDLAIIGFNNSILAQCCDPEITSIDNRVEVLSRTTVKLLMDILSGEEVPHQTVIDTVLIERQTG